MNSVPESVFDMENSNLNDICKIIHNNLSKQTGDELFDIIENDIPYNQDRKFSKGK